MTLAFSGLALIEAQILGAIVIESKLGKSRDIQGTVMRSGRCLGGGFNGEGSIFRKHSMACQPMACAFQGPHHLSQQVSCLSLLSPSHYFLSLHIPDQRLASFLVNCDF